MTPRLSSSGTPGIEQGFGANYGLMTSTSTEDGEARWRWTPDDATGGTPVAWAVGSDGVVLAATDIGLLATRDGGCTYASVDANLEDVAITSMISADSGRLWLTSETPSGGDVWASDNGGVSWRALGVGGEDVLMARVERDAQGVIWASGFDRARRARLVWRVSEGSDGVEVTEVADDAILVGPGIIARANARWTIEVLDEAKHVDLPEGAPVTAIMREGALYVHLEDDTLVVWSEDGSGWRTLPGKTRCLIEGNDGALWRCQRTVDGDAHFSRKAPESTVWEEVYPFASISPADCPEGTPGHALIASQWGILQNIGVGPKSEPAGERMDAHAGCCAQHGMPRGIPRSPPLAVLLVLGVLTLRARTRPQGSTSVRTHRRCHGDHTPNHRQAVADARRARRARAHKT